MDYIKMISELVSEVRSLEVKNTRKNEIIADLRKELALSQDRSEMEESYIDLARAYTDLQIRLEKRIKELQEIAERQAELEQAAFENYMDY